VVVHRPPFVKGLAEKRCLEKNLWVKKFIKNIVYSKEQIELSLFYSTTFNARAFEVLPSRQSRDGFRNEKRTPGPKAENPQFDLLKMARIESPRPTMPLILPNTIHRCQKKNLKLLRRY